MKKYNPFLLFACTVATMGGLMFGFDIAIVSGAVPFIQSYFGWDELELGWGVSSLLLGAIIGAGVSGPLADRFGRKRVVVVVALFFALSCLGMALSHGAAFFIGMRLLGGITVGGISVLAPMYVAEIAPAAIRGKLVSIYQLAIVTGILGSYLINYGLHDWADNWRWMFATGVVPSTVYFVGLLFIPESPRWLYLHGRKAEAREVLLRLGSAEDAEREIAQIEASIGRAATERSRGVLWRASVRKPMLVGILLAIFVQMCGINSIIDYAPKILLSAGLEIKNALLQTSLIGLINFLFTFVAIALIERVGRRRLYILGSVLLTLSMGLIAGSFHWTFSPALTLLCILLAVGSFAAFIGPVFWVMVSEMFPNSARGSLVALTTFMVWAANFVVIMFFPHFFARLGGAVSFLFFAGMSLMQLLVAWFMVPETAGKTLEEIETLWEKKS